MRDFSSTGLACRAADTLGALIIAVKRACLSALDGRWLVSSEGEFLQAPLGCFRDCDCVCSLDAKSWKSLKE